MKTIEELKARREVIRKEVESHPGGRAQAFRRYSAEVRIIDECIAYLEHGKTEDDVLLQLKSVEHAIRVHKDRFAYYKLPRGIAPDKKWGYYASLVGIKDLEKSVKTLKYLLG